MYIEAFRVKMNCLLEPDTEFSNLNSVKLEPDTEFWHLNSVKPSLLFLTCLVFVFCHQPSAFSSPSSIKRISSSSLHTFDARFSSILLFLVISWATRNSFCFSLHSLVIYSSSLLFSSIIFLLAERVSFPNLVASTSFYFLGETSISSISILSRDK